jgi:hypothetical protein
MLLIYEGILTVLRQGRHRQEGHAAQAPAYLRHAAIGERRTIGGHPGPARA